jgi:hypothetical protein
LEAPVEQHAVHDVGTDASADDILGFEDGDLDTGADQVSGARQAGQTGSDDDDLRHRRSLVVDSTALYSAWIS